MSPAEGFRDAARGLSQLHEHPAVIARWRAWTGPLLSRLTPPRRRALLALGALYVIVRRPIREMAPAVDARAPVDPLAGALVVLLCLVAVGAVYLAARRFASLPAVVRGRPQLWLHGGFWVIVVLGWLVHDGGGVIALTLSGLVLALAFLLWRMGYLLLSSQRGRMAGTRFSDHLLYLYPAYGGSGVPYGKGLDHLARHEARSEEALARSQLAGLKLLALSVIYTGLLTLMAGLVYAEPRGTWSMYGLGLSRVEALLPSGARVPWTAAWSALYAGLVWDVLKIAARGHEIVGVLRLFGFNVFRNTYKPLLAPSLVEFWNRYYYYFKELLVDFFFFPVYVRYFRRSPRLRMFAATLAAAGVGNLYYHLLQQDPFVLTGSWAALWPWLESRSVYCLVLALGIYVSMRREQQRRGATAVGPAGWAVQLRRIAGVWTFFALLRVLDNPGGVPLGQRVDFLLGLIGLR